MKIVFSDFFAWANFSLLEKKFSPGFTIVGEKSLQWEHFEV